MCAAECGGVSNPHSCCVLLSRTHYCAVCSSSLHICSSFWQGYGATAWPCFPAQAICRCGSLGDASGWVSPPEKKIKRSNHISMHPVITFVSCVSWVQRRGTKLIFFFFSVSTQCVQNWSKVNIYMGEGKEYSESGYTGLNAAFYSDCVEIFLNLI